MNTRENGRFEIRGHIRHVIRLRERLPQEAAQFAICCPAETWADLEEESEEGRKALARDVEEDSRKKTRFSNCQFYPISVSPLAG
ncbi:MAG: hypothetical protein O2960_29385, partial [Verrucomicrobia bacterium]|nr:hypothetical protein [Verrucomicrobiota bacterium]